VSIPVVYDTMLFLQAAVQPHRVHRTFRAVQDGLVNLCVSLELLAEVRDVLTRLKVREKFPALTPNVVDTFISETAALATIYDPPSVFTWPKDPDDDHIFNLAIHAEAKYLVTWETRMLKLATEPSAVAESLRRLSPKLEIVNPEQFVMALYPRKSP
jgi:putative PIN family toxin of toxin-antitoxin system